jgi:N-methylhydantoinase B
MDSIELSLFVSRMEAVCDEMGVVLRRTAFSPNIKDRLDFSCALFDASGDLCAQAAHIPVHLGSMAFAMRSIVDRFEWQDGDVLILNDPFLGGTHLPDVTVIAPLLDQQGELLAFVVNRAHHANIGSDTPGSMPNSSCLQEEGLIIEPQKLYSQGRLNQSLAEKLAAVQSRAARTQDEDIGGDFAAQISALHAGKHGLTKLIHQLGREQFTQALKALNDYGEQIALTSLSKLPAGSYTFTDYMDDDGLGNRDLRINLQLTVTEGRIVADFTGTDQQAAGNVNCPLSVTAAAVYYVFRCLMPENTPACAGIFRHIHLQAPAGSLVNAVFPAAVVAGNVETSSRIVDVVLGALQSALPGEIPAASQGTMNNIAMGYYSEKQYWDYYETLAGGTGAGAAFAGLSAVHSHMTNTLNTPVESLELHYPVRIRRYAIRRGSGGAGKHRGGDGLCREYEFLEKTQVSILSERRTHGCWGLLGAQAGDAGENLLDGKALAGKCSFTALPGQRLSINTPGGGGWGGGETAAIS